MRYDIFNCSVNDRSYLSKLGAACSILNCPDIFCFTFTLRLARPEALLSGGRSIQAVVLWLFFLFDVPCF